jgi:hypothetical protein
MFRERVYVLGSGERARTVVETLRTRRDAGMEVVGWRGEGEVDGRIERFAADLRAFCEPKPALTASSLPWKTAADRCRFENCLTFASAALSLKIPAR